MPSLKELRNRISSVKATQKITKAMQMVAAAKLRRAQEQAEAGRPYAERMATVLVNLAGAFEGRDDAPKLLAGTGKDDVHLLLVATAERGLCGAFNTNIARLARDHALRLKNEGKTVKILCVGRKGDAVLRRQFAADIIELISFVEEKNVGYVHASQVGRRVLELFDAGEFDVCTLFFSRFKSVISQLPTAQRLIPARLGLNQVKAEFSAEEGSGYGADDWSKILWLRTRAGMSKDDIQSAIGSRLTAAGTAAALDELLREKQIEVVGSDLAAYEYEPEEAEILEDLLPRNLNTQIYRAILENAASEQGARMSAMDNATRNAGDMIDRLTLVYNRTRQAQITKELIEIISGAEAL